MAKFSDYLDSGYLPGEVYSAGLESLDPMTKALALAERKFAFEPTEDGSFFQNFLALQANPQAALLKNVRLPERLQQFISMANGQ